MIQYLRYQTGQVALSKEIKTPTIDYFVFKKMKFYEFPLELV